MISQEEIKEIILQLENLIASKTDITHEINGILSEAKNKGYNVKILRQILKLRQLNNNERLQEEEDLETYKTAVGMN